MHLTQVSDLQDARVIEILDRAVAIKAAPEKFQTSLNGKILGLMFFEPSTRTYFSFASAMMRGGGNMLGFNGIEWTSMVKGESIEDTARMMASYVDVLVCRHRDIGTNQKLAAAVNVPVINAGEGTGEHPTQTLTDLFTIRERFGRLDIRMGLYGDLKHSRTIHSIVLLGSRLGMSFYGFAPPGFELPQPYIDVIKQHGSSYQNDPEFPPTKLGHLDALYINRLQKERLGIDQPPPSYFDVPLVTPEFARNLSPDCIVMDPLPRINTTDPAFDKDVRAVYFTQAANGVPVRMALIQALLF